MELITPEIRAALLANGRRAADDDDFDPMPVVKFFTPDANSTWLLTEVDPDDPDILYGLCDLGMGCPEFGSVSLRELQEFKGLLGMPIERDLYFQPKYPISVYIANAMAARHIAA